MKVMRGKAEAPNKKAMDDEEKEHYRFRELMIRNKDKRLYKSMMESRRKRENEAKKLETKRKAFDTENKGKWSIQSSASNKKAKTN